MKMIMLNLVLFIYIMFSTAVTSDVVWILRSREVTKHLTWFYLYLTRPVIEGKCRVSLGWPEILLLII